MKAIVTGAAGFIGQALVKELLSHGYSVFAIDIKDSLDFHSPNLFYCKLSINEIEEITQEKNGNFDFFFHLAWAGSSGEYRSNIDLQTANTIASIQCIRAAKKLGCTKFIVAGTIMELETLNMVYQSHNNVPITSVYSSSKIYTHLLLRAISSDLKIDLVWAYITNAYGVGERSPRLINTIIRKLISGDRVEFTSAEQNYDFVYIDDVSIAFRLLGEYGKADFSYVIGSSTAKPLKEFIKEIFYLVDPERTPVFGTIPYFGPMLNKEDFSTDLIESHTGFKPKVSFHDGILRTYEYLKEDENE